jgi:membrane protein DedA with SNARE-associated domain
MTIYIILITLAVGVIVGGGIGFKLGRGYERVRPTKKTKKKTTKK